MTLCLGLGGCLDGSLGIAGLSGLLDRDALLGALFSTGAAAGAAVGGVTAGGAGGIDHSGLIAVTQCVGIFLYAYAILR